MRSYRSAVPRKCRLLWINKGKDKGSETCDEELRNDDEDVMDTLRRSVLIKR
jgi:hypothetical protein